MPISRRSFLVGAAATGVSMAFLRGDSVPTGIARLEPDARSRIFSNNPVGQGANSTWLGHNHLVVNSRMCPPRSNPQPHIEGTISVFDRNTGERVAVQTVHAKLENDFRVTAAFEGMDPQRQYRYQVCANEINDRTFSGFTQSPLVRPVEGPDYGRGSFVRLVFASCMEYRTGFWNAFSSMSQLNPDAVFIIGDSIYADTEETIFTRDSVRRDVMPYADSYALFLMKHLVCNDADKIRMLSNSPGYFVLDDHEIRNNIEGSDVGKRQMVNDGYHAYSRVYAGPNGAAVRGLYRRIDFGNGTRVLLLDTRRFRDAASGKMLGDKQLAWLKQEFAQAKSDNVTKLIGVSSVSLISGLERIQDSWAGFPQERQQIIDEISRLGLKNVTFVTGDLHRFFAGAIRLDPADVNSEVIGIEQEVGAVSSKVGGGDSKVNPNVLAYSLDENGVMSMDIRDDGSSITTWWLYNARDRTYVAKPGAVFFSPAQSEYGSPQLSLQLANPGSIRNPGELEILR